MFFTLYSRTIPKESQSMYAAAPETKTKPLTARIYGRQGRGSAERDAGNATKETSRDHRGAGSVAYTRQQPAAGPARRKPLTARIYGRQGRGQQKEMPETQRRRQAATTAAQAPSHKRGSNWQRAPHARNATKETSRDHRGAGSVKFSAAAIGCQPC